MRISDWSSDVCSSDLRIGAAAHLLGNAARVHRKSPRNPAIRQLARLLIGARWRDTAPTRRQTGPGGPDPALRAQGGGQPKGGRKAGRRLRSEEHTFKLQSILANSYSVFSLTKKT